MITIEKRQFKSIKYLVYYPIDYEEGKTYPVFFHLHGSGSRGNNFQEFRGSTILSILEKEDSPLSHMVCVFPQCHEDNWFAIFNDLIDLANHIYQQRWTDKMRFNGSGISMGAYALYSLMQCVPELFNKAVVCCGGGMYWNSGRLKNIKFRIFHGELDTAVYPEEARRMYDRLKEALADVTLTIYPDCDHNCWDKTYTNYDNLNWLVTK